MILSCPSCGAKFKIDASKLGPKGRTVRCSKCKHTWHAEPAGEAAEEAERQARRESDPRGLPGPDAEAGAGAARDDGAAAPDAERSGTDDAGAAGAGVEAFESSLRASRYRSYAGADEDDEEVPFYRSALIGWGLLVVVLIALAGGLYQFRAQVVAEVPQAARVYQAVGIQVPAAGAGLEFRDLTRTRRLVDGESLLVFEGRIVNTLEAAAEVPPLRVRLYDAAGDELTSWTFEADAARLPPGGETTFSSRREDPPDTAREFSLTFDPRED